MGSGMNGQIGVIKEVTVGTHLAVSRFFRFTSESLNLNVHDYQSQAIGGSLVLGQGERVVTYQDGAGSIVLDVPTEGFGPILKQALGVAAPVLTQQAATTAWLQTHALPATGGQNGMALTVQKGVADDSATQPFTFGGCKVVSIEFDCKIGGGLTCTVGLDAMDVVSPTVASGVNALQAASYLTGSKVYNFSNFLSVKLGGTVATTSGVAAVTSGVAPASLIKGFNVKLDWGLAADRISIINGITKREQLINDRPKITGTLAAEFTNSTDLYDLYRSGASTALEVVMRSDLIASTYYHEIRFVIPAIQFTGDTPNVAGYDVIELDSPYIGTYDGINTPLQIQYQASQATAAL